MSKFFGENAGKQLVRELLNATGTALQGKADLVGGKVPAGQIPGISWNDLTDKPFYDETDPGINLTLPDIANSTYISGEMTVDRGDGESTALPVRFYRVGDTVTQERLIGGRIVAPARGDGVEDVDETIIADRCGDILDTNDNPVGFYIIGDAAPFPLVVVTFADNTSLLYEHEHGGFSVAATILNSGTYFFYGDFSALYGEEMAIQTNSVTVDQTTITHAMDSKFVGIPTTAADDHDKVMTVDSDGAKVWKTHKQLNMSYNDLTDKLVWEEETDPGFEIDTPENPTWITLVSSDPTFLKMYRVANAVPASELIGGELTYATDTGSTPTETTVTLTAQNVVEEDAAEPRYCIISGTNWAAISVYESYVSVPVFGDSFQFDSGVYFSEYRSGGVGETHIAVTEIQNSAVYTRPADPTSVDHIMMSDGESNPDDPILYRIGNQVTAEQLVGGTLVYSATTYSDGEPVSTDTVTIQLTAENVKTEDGMIMAGGDSCSVYVFDDNATPGDLTIQNGGIYAMDGRLKSRLSVQFVSLTLGFVAELPAVLSSSNWVVDLDDDGMLIQMARVGDTLAADDLHDLQMTVGDHTGATDTDSVDTESIDTGIYMLYSDGGGSYLLVMSDDTTTSELGDEPYTFSEGGLYAIKESRLTINRDGTITTTYQYPIKLFRERQTVKHKLDSSFVDMDVAWNDVKDRPFYDLPNISITAPSRGSSHIAVDGSVLFDVTEGSYQLGFDRVDYTATDCAAFYGANLAYTVDHIEQTPIALSASTFETTGVGAYGVFTTTEGDILVPLLVFTEHDATSVPFAGANGSTIYVSLPTAGLYFVWTYDTQDKDYIINPNSITRANSKKKLSTDYLNLSEIFNDAFVSEGSNGETIVNLPGGKTLNLGKSGINSEEFASLFETQAASSTELQSQINTALAGFDALPEVTNTNNGSFLYVENGEWIVKSFDVAEGSVF